MHASSYKKLFRYAIFGKPDVIESQQEKRQRKIVQTAITSLISKLCAIVTMLISIKLIQQSYSPEIFGIWMTLNSLILATTFLDFGIGNGIQNSVSESEGKGSQEKSIATISNGFYLLCFLSLMYIVTSLLVGSYLSQAGSERSLSIGSENSIYISIILFSILLFAQLPTTIVQKVFSGLQEGVSANIWTILSSIITLIAIATTLAISDHFPLLVIASVGTPLLISIISFFYLFTYLRPSFRPRLYFVTKRTSQSLLRQGGLWTWFNLLSFCALSLDNLIISFLAGPEHVGPYAATTKIYSALLLTQILSAPLWPAYIDAISTGDVEWAIRTFKKITMLFLCFGFICCAIMVLFCKPIIRVWLGDNLVPDNNIVIGFALWCIVSNVFSGVSSLMANSHMIKMLSIFVTIAIGVSLPLKYFLFPYYGTEGVIWATVIGYSTVLIPAILYAHREMKAIALKKRAFRNLEI